MPPSSSKPLQALMTFVCSTTCGTGIACMVQPMLQRVADGVGVSVCGWDLLMDSVPMIFFESHDAAIQATITGQTPNAAWNHAVRQPGFAEMAGAGEWRLLPLSTDRVRYRDR